MRLFFRRACLAGCVLLAFGVHAVQAQAFSTLEERMSAAQFRAAGLDKLSEEELAALNAWLQANAGAPAAVAPATAPPAATRIGFREQDVKGTVVSALDGTFTGWDGKTVFNLENGQVWQQIEQGRLDGVNLERPMITIEPGMFGSWRLKVEGLNATTRVKRIQ